MNLIARCPACKTSYRVVPDQLRISDGWFRCGQCGEVFDTSPQRVDAEIGQPTTEAREPADDWVEAHRLIPDDQQVSSLPTSDSPARQDATGLSVSEGAWASAALLIKPSSEAEANAGEPAATSMASVAAPVSFMLASEGPSSTRRESRPALWWALGGLLLLGLLLQGVYRERDQLAASLPAMKPALVYVCEFLACRIAPQQTIESLAIDSATFQQVGQDSFELRFTVKNKSQIELALPAVELTLTDLADQPVIRRVFTPAELGVAPATVASAGEWSATAYLQLRADAIDARAKGYRLLIFYP